MDSQPDLKKKVDDEHIEARPDAHPDESRIREEFANLSDEDRITIEKRLKRKLDLRLFPCLLIFYILNYIDRNALPAARLLGLEDDLKLQGTN